MQNVGFLMIRLINVVGMFTFSIAVMYLKHLLVLCKMELFPRITMAQGCIYNLKRICVVGNICVCVFAGMG